MTYSKPMKRIVSLDAARAWSPNSFLIQVKCDGQFQTRSLPASAPVALVAGELMRPRSGQFLTLSHKRMLEQCGGEFFVAWDLLAMDGMDVSQQSTKTRWCSLLGLVPWFPGNWILVQHGSAGFVDWCFENGAEGVCAKAWDSPYGSMLACKRLSTHLCTVTQIGGSQSVGFAELIAGGFVDRGRIKLGGSKVDKVRVGSVLKVSSMGETDAGKLREPRLDNDSPDSWLHRF